MKSQNRPILKWAAGVSATVISGILIFWLTQGIQKKSATEHSGSPSASSVTNYKATQATITISYDLDKMEEGRAIVYINGREAGSLYVDKNKRNSSINITLPKPGNYEYSVQAKMTIMGIVDLETRLELPFEYDSNGRGTIEVEDGKEFILTTNNLSLNEGGNNTWYAILIDKALH